MRQFMNQNSVSSQFNIGIYEEESWQEFKEVHTNNFAQLNSLWDFTNAPV
jgi:hypothetical protein